MTADTGTPPLRFAVIDDDRFAGDGLAQWVAEADPGLTVALTVRSWHELLADPRFPSAVDVALLDLNLQDGIPVRVKLAMLRSASIPTVVISTLCDPPHVRKSIAAGALGYVPKSANPSDIARALRAAAAGESYVTRELAEALLGGGPGDAAPELSEQENRTLTLYASGLPLKSVARQMDVSFHTARSYLDRVRQKYEDAGREARTKIDLRKRAVEDGYVEDPPKEPK